MCGIAGFIDYKRNFLTEKRKHEAIADKMAERIRHRGPDAKGVCVCEHTVFSHARLAVIDPNGGKQPMSRISGGYEFIITYNGELYNTEELRNTLKSYGYVFTTHSDTEVLLYMYIHYGTECTQYLNGIYAFCIWDSMRQRIFAVRDRFGVKPFFYTFADGTFVFSSEIKSLFEYPGIVPEISDDSLREIFAVSPPRTQGTGTYKNIFELEPGSMIVYDRNSFKKERYWQIKAMEHKDSYEDTVSKVRELVIDSVKRQLVSDVPLATFLSGGLDSSVITAIAAIEAKKNSRRLDTYSFEYKDNSKYFHPTAFQPDSDDYWAKRMSEAFDTNHRRLICMNEYLADNLEKAEEFKDLPGMADVDVSLMYFCSEVKKNHTVVLSGECSDELFGGYPWFRSEKAFNTAAFPWSYDMSIRNGILRDEVRERLNLDEYAFYRYNESVKMTPAYSGDSAEEKRRREIAFLNINWFMLNLLERKDRMSMASGLEVRVPFCDHRLAEYVYNIPWEIKNKDNVSKSVLREAMRGILPDDVLYRKKSPYPKTHNPIYENEVKEKVRKIIEDKNSPILEYADKSKIEELIEKKADLGSPFFGQLMALPQFLGYIVQVNHWLKNFC